MRNIFGWSYPPGAEHDPSAPYNQTDEDIPDCDGCLIQDSCQQGVCPDDEENIDD